MTPAVDVLKCLNINFQLHTFSNEVAHDFARHAAEKLGVVQDQVIKTLIAEDNARQLWVALVPSNRTLNLKALAKVAGVKKMILADQARAEKVTGYIKGAISPLGQKTDLPTLMDTHVLAQPRILVSGGRRGLEIELDPQDLQTIRRAVSGSFSREG